MKCIHTYRLVHSRDRFTIYCHIRKDTHRRNQVSAYFIPPTGITNKSIAICVYNKFIVLFSEWLPTYSPFCHSETTKMQKVSKCMHIGTEIV